jgi:hypothetical protein
VLGFIISVGGAGALGAGVRVSTKDGHMSTAKVLIAVGVAIGTTFLVLSRPLLHQRSGSFLDFGPGIYWAGQWLAFWSLAAGLAWHAWALRQGPVTRLDWTVLSAGLLAWAFLVIVALPEPLDSGLLEPTTGIASYVRLKLKSLDFDRHNFEVTTSGTVGGVPLKAKIWVSLDEQGRTVELYRKGPDPYVYQGVNIDNAKLFPGTTRLEAASLFRGEDQEIQGYAVRGGRGGPFGDVTFDVQGRLVEFRLAKPQRIATVLWPEETFVEVTPRGFKLWPTKADWSFSIAGLEIPASTWVGISPEGRLIWLDTFNSRPIRKGKLVLGPKLRFREDGTLREAALYEDAVVLGTSAKKGARILFDARGEPSGIQEPEYGAPAFDDEP